MAINSIETLKALDSAMKYCGIEYEDCNMGELGNCLMWPHQVCWGAEFEKIESLKLHVNRYVAKDYFKQIKNIKSHTSIDTNGKNGALKIDLRYPVDTSSGFIFDVITNFGTTEHVESVWPEDQYAVFENIHNMRVVLLHFQL